MEHGSQTLDDIVRHEDIDVLLQVSLRVLRKTCHDSRFILNPAAHTIPVDMVLLVDYNIRTQS